MEKILVPTDFSENAENALYLAQQIAAKNKAEVIVVNAIEPEKFYTVAEDGTYKDAKEDKKYLEHLQGVAGQKLKDLVVKYEISNVLVKIDTGKPTEIIKKYAQEEDVDLVVIGTHQTSALEEMVLGSYTDKIIHAVKRPVLTIKKRLDNFKVEHIAYATDLKESGGAITKGIQKIQELFKAKMHLVYVNTPANFYNTRKIQDLKEAFVEANALENYTFSIYDDYTIETGIAHFSDDTNADLIALAAHHYNNLMEMAKSDYISENVIDQASKPVLSFSI